MLEALVIVMTHQEYGEDFNRKQKLPVFIIGGLYEENVIFNVQHKIQGWCDSPLTELGKKQAIMAGKYYKDNQITFDHAYCSTSERCCDTLELVTDHQMPYTRLKGLKEWNFGAFEGKDEFLCPQLPYGDFFVAYGGESEQALRDRMNKTLQAIMSQNDHESVLVVSHGAACAQFYRAWESCAKVQREGRIYNCCIFKYEVENNQFILTEIINRNITE